MVVAIDAPAAIKYRVLQPSEQPPSNHLGVEAGVDWALEKGAELDGVDEVMYTNTEGTFPYLVLAAGGMVPVVDSMTGKAIIERIHVSAPASPGLSAPLWLKLIAFPLPIGRLIWLVLLALPASVANAVVLLHLPLTSVSIEPEIASAA